MKIISLIAIMLASATSFAKGAEDHNLKLISLIETTFSKPAVISRPDRIKGKDFNFSSFKLKKTNEGQKEYISNFLKLNEMNLIENSSEVHIMRANRSVKMNIPVFNEEVPSKIREQMVTLIHTIPKHLRNKRIDKVLRPHYSSNGDLRISSDKKKFIIADWASNAKKIIGIINSL